MRVWLAPSINPPAAALAMPSHRSLIFRTNTKGSAPRPVATAVIMAAMKT